MRGSTPSLGEGQSWQNVTSVRNAGGIFQNTTGRTIAVSAAYRENGVIEVSPDGSNWVRIAGIDGYSNNMMTSYQFVVPASHFYRIRNAHSGHGGHEALLIDHWSELR